jgi:hypothetical protein
LLDWLANEFVRSGWSLKWLHRTIVTSATYQQSSLISDSKESAQSIDSENRLLWRMNRRRLEGESLRDAMLSVSGQLNPKAGGPSIYPDLPDEIKKSAKNWPTSAKAEDRNRRSVYVAVRRNLRYPLLALFDAPDANETCARRFATTTAPQALMLLNDDLIVGIARQFADHVSSIAGKEPAAVVRTAFKMAVGREPNSEERTAMLQFLERRLQTSGETTDAVTDFCHAILNLNEFLFVD